MTDKAHKADEASVANEANEANQAFAHVWWQCQKQRKR